MAKKRPQQRQPKQPSKRAQREAAAAKATFADDDESISSASEDDELQQPPVTEEREETVEEARLRRARAYVSIERGGVGFDEDDLNERAARAAGRGRGPSRGPTPRLTARRARRAVVLKGHRGPVTSVRPARRGTGASREQGQRAAAARHETGQKVRTPCCAGRGRPTWPSRRRGLEDAANRVGATHAARQARGPRSCVWRRRRMVDHRLGRQRPPILSGTRAHLSPLAAGPRRRALALAFRDALGFEDDEDDDEEDNDREQPLFSASGTGTQEALAGRGRVPRRDVVCPCSAVSALIAVLMKDRGSGGRDRAPLFGRSGTRRTWFFACRTTRAWAARGRRPSVDRDRFVSAATGRLEFVVDPAQEARRDH